MLNNKKKFIVGLLSVAACGGLLASCNDVVAVPNASDYNGAILTNADGTNLNVANNTLKQIYDAVVTEGDTNSEKVLNNVLFIYSKSIFGDFFNELKPAIDANDTTKLQAIADSYAVYHDTEGKGQIQKVKNMYADILYRIKKVFYGYVTNSSYQERNQFVEKKFYDAQTKANYELGSDYFSEHIQVSGSFRLSEETLNADELNVFFKDLFTTYKTYIIQAVLPDIYRDELVCQYLYKENYRTLGINYARKVDYIKLAANASYPAATANLVKAYSNIVIENGTADDQKTYDLTFLDRLSKGYFDFAGDDATIQAKANAIYDEAGWTSFTTAELAIVDSGTGDTGAYNYVRKESTLGGYLTSFSKIYDTSVTTDANEVKDFTNSGAYTANTGLKIKIQTLEGLNDTTNGWYTSTGLTDLPSAMKKRLFKMAVANEVDTLTEASPKGEYVWLRGGNYYLIPENYETSTNTTPYAMSDSGTWYIFKVEEAVKSSKLSSTDTANYYDTIRNTPYLAEKIARKVAATLSSSDTYKKDSNKYFVEKMAIVYHDDYVYNYFVKTFPDLFD